MEMQLKRCVLATGTQQDIAQLVFNMRPEDVAECRAGGTDMDAVIKSCKELMGVAPLSLVALRSLDGTLLALGGVLPCTVYEGFGYPWFLCTKQGVTGRNKGALWEGIKAMDARVVKDFKFLANRLWVPNTEHSTLVKKLGYKIEPEVDAKGFAMFSKKGDYNV